MSDLAQEGHWRWSSGATLSLTNWWPGEPNNLNGNENGGEIWTGGKWNDTPTSRELPSVCERNSSCPSSWTKFEASCYAYVYEPSSWADATVRTFGGHLVELDTAIENIFVHNLINNLAAQYTWIGATDLLVDGHWLLATSRKPLPFTNWQVNEPNNADGRGLEGCAFMNRANGQWLDASCSSLWPLVCETPAAASGH
ncbi:hypothetical protein C0Q70_10473 [Pomacea canaliculata]|uniref:C-type lectin domain-containing protein n=1 Tax=Pomacea canaliculata TaxID=400727 RepID=A0A2T7P3B2_POMCA|nr:hypothetical protein C0Q70_10473 [Pomacea canaliculata]